MSYREHYKYWNSLSADSIKKRSANFKSLLVLSHISSTTTLVLDVGCGDGVAMLTMKEYGITQIEGIDINDGQIEAAQSLGLDAKIIIDPISYLTSKPNQFNLITLFDVLEHVEKERQILFLSAINCALKPGGKILLTTPNANASFASRFRYGDWTHHCSFTEHSLKYVMHEAHFTEISILPAEKKDPIWKILIKPYALKEILLRSFRMIRRLEAILEFGRSDGASMPLSLNLLAVAKKND